MKVLGTDMRRRGEMFLGFWNHRPVDGQLPWKQRIAIIAELVKKYPNSRYNARHSHKDQRDKDIEKMIRLGYLVPCQPAWRPSTVNLLKLTPLGETLLKKPVVIEPREPYKKRKLDMALFQEMNA